MRRITVSIMAGAMLFGTGITSQASTVTVETVSAWDGVNGVFDFGEPDTATYGQTFRTPDATHTVLEEFTFYLRELSPGESVQFGAYIYAWDTGTDRAIGPNLFQTGMLETTNNGGSGGFEAITIATGGISLDSGVDYVAYFSASEYFNSTNSFAAFGSIVSDVYSDGAFVFNDNGANPSEWTNSPWEVTWITAHDLAFEMTFSDGLSVIPLPPAAAMGFLMMGLLGAIRHRRRTH